ncbi:hypothetical protein K8R33_02030, partial [archaeon]|nr:hypothetical protein [archaeon]
SNPSNSLQYGVCSGSVQICSGGGWIDDYSSVSDYESGDETSCYDGKDNDCDGSTDGEDSNCDSDSYELNLYEGTWNFVSIPLSNLDYSIDKFDSDIVLSYSGSSWEMDYKEVINELFTIETSKGYIVYSDSDKTITFNGVLDDTYVYPLEADTWNLVGSTIDGYVFEGNQIFDNTTSITSGDVLVGNSYWVYTGTEPQEAPLTQFWEFLPRFFRSKVMMPFR